MIRHVHQSAAQVLAAAGTKTRRSTGQGRVETRVKAELGRIPGSAPQAYSLSISRLGLPSTPQPHALPAWLLHVEPMVSSQSPAARMLSSQMSSNSRPHCFNVAS